MRGHYISVQNYKLSSYSLFKFQRSTFQKLIYFTQQNFLVFVVPPNNDLNNFLHHIMASPIQLNLCLWTLIRYLLIVLISPQALRKAFSCSGGRFLITFFHVISSPQNSILSHSNLHLSLKHSSNSTMNFFTALISFQYIQGVY